MQFGEKELKLPVSDFEKRKQIFNFKLITVFCNSSYKSNVRSYLGEQQSMYTGSTRENDQRETDSDRHYES